MTSAPTTELPAASTAGVASLRRWERLSFSVAHAAVSLLLAGLSPKGLYAFGRAFGTLEWMINYKRRRRFAQRCAEVAPGRGRPAREFFCRSRCDKLFYLILDRVTREQAATLFSIGNRALLDDAVRRGKGVYVALSHHGAHHIAAIMLAQAGYRVAGVRNRSESAIRRFVQQRLDRRRGEVKNFRIIFSDAYPRDIYRCFQEGYVLGSLMDVAHVHRPNQKFEEVTLFGETHRFLSGPMRVAIRCGAPILQAFIVPGSGFRYCLDIVEQLVAPSNVQDEDAAVTRALQTYAKNLELHVRAHPELMTRI